MIYLLSADFKNLNEPLSDWSDFLDEDRRKKVDRYRFYKDKALGTFAYILLRYALKKEYGIEEKPKLIYDSSGKPYIDGSDICFNFSHCENAVACVVDKKTVGIDLQNYTETLIQVKKRFLTEKEMKLFDGSGEENEAGVIRTLARIWTLKEAYGKYRGDGLIYDIREKDFLSVNNSPEWQQYEDLNVYSEEKENFAVSVFSGAEMKLQKLSIKDIRLDISC
ncbi:4'-phosphopantetheinyl transferase [Oribacterium sp. KHPX15]|uniref:4'-phosphopantetheinyl transferase superfamily protein n=1 Tax=Oribacterium sp. KHPX15 TaxID=1855342 RepID=UPI00089CE360|nr:4'-phosphopantetheinyl transferase superfamily protein [Oribacterium sp. KHPX15]SEA64097.1 4'-phosphopantetheinyl transferase [Oribacterium sp. KHPX15]